MAKRLKSLWIDEEILEAAQRFADKDRRSVSFILHFWLLQGYGMAVDDEGHEEGTSSSRSIGTQSAEKIDRQRPLAALNSPSGEGKAPEAQSFDAPPRIRIGSGLNRGEVIVPTERVVTDLGNGLSIDIQAPGACPICGGMNGFHQPACTEAPYNAPSLETFEEINGLSGTPTNTEPFHQKPKTHNCGNEIAKGFTNEPTGSEEKTPAPRSDEEATAPRRLQPGDQSGSQRTRKKGLLHGKRSDTRSPQTAAELPSRAREVSVTIPGVKTGAEIEKPKAPLCKREGHSGFWRADGYWCATCRKVLHPEVPEI